MIIVIIICGILYLFMIYGVISLYYTYRKDIEEIEKRLLQLEKRINECETFKKSWEALFNNANDLNGLIIGDNYFVRKESDNMACKKGRGGRKK